MAKSFVAYTLILKLEKKFRAHATIMIPVAKKKRVGKKKSTVREAVQVIAKNGIREIFEQKEEGNYFLNRRHQTRL